MSSLPRFLSFLENPAPEFAFEISADGIAMSRTRPPASPQHVPLGPGVIAPSPVKENILDPTAFAAAVKKLAPPATGRGRRGAALILPDNTARIAIVDFETLPEKEEELRALISFRLRKTVPFDVDEAALSWYIQGKGKLVVVLAPAEIVAHYETPFRAAGFHPGLVTVSSLAMLDLLPTKGLLVAARLSPGSLTVLGLKDGVITIVRSLELAGGDTLAEISADLYPTLAFIEDQGGGRPEHLFIAGFGPGAHAAAARLSADLAISVEPMPQENPGLAGYLVSLTPGRQVAA